MTKMWCQLVTDSLNEYSYSAEVAGLGYSLLNTKEGVRVKTSSFFRSLQNQLTIKGYNCKQDILVRKVVEKMVHLEIDPERFHVIQEQEQRGYNNFDKGPPYSSCLYETAVTLEFPR
jgi:insulysin